MDATSQLVETTRQQGENTTQLGAEQRERFEQEMVALRELRQITDRQAEIIRDLTAGVVTLARSVDTTA